MAFPGLDLAGKLRMGESLLKRPEPTAAGGSVADSSSTIAPPSSPVPTVATEGPELQVPEIIPFLQPRQPSKSGYKNRWSDEQFRQAYRQAQQLEVDNSTDLPAEAKEWTVAGETHYDDSERPKGDWKGLVDCIEFRWGMIEENQIFQILKSIPGVNGSNHSSFRQRLIRRANGAKSGTTWFLMLSMEHLAEIVPEFTTATRRQRQSLLSRIFNRAPVTISRNAFSSDKNSVSFENMFRSNEGLRTHWQIFTRTKFVNLALDAYEDRVLNGDSREGTENFTSSYVRHSLSECYGELELGGTRAVPTKGEYDKATKNLKRKRSAPSS